MKTIALAACVMLVGCYATDPESRVQSAKINDTIPTPDVGLPSYSETIDARLCERLFKTGYVLDDRNEVCDVVWQAVKDDARSRGGDSAAIVAAVDGFVADGVCVVDLVTY